MLYDPLGRLFQISSAAGVTQLLYDRDELVAEASGTAAIRRRYVHSLGSDDPQFWYEDGARRMLFADHEASILAVANASGYSVGINSYDEWGIPDAGNVGRFQFTGQAWLSEVGLYYYKARFYSPTLGRFMQTDPIGYDGGLNLYAYVGDDPINRNDPAGTCINGATSPNARETAKCQPAANVSVSARGADTIIQNEGGVRFRAYASAEGGSPTVGIGHKVQPGDHIRTGDVISRAQVVEFFRRDLVAADAAVHRLLGNTPVSQEEFDALTDLAFNAGGGTFSPLRSPNLNRATQARDYEAMSNELRYTHGGGRSLTNLAERSDRRRAMFRDGVYPPVPWRR